MTRRIRLAIVLTAWALLAVGGLGGYLVFRQVLLAELDKSLATRATLLPELLGISRDPSTAPRGPEQVPLPPGDRFVVKDDKGRTLASLFRNRTEIRDPVVIDRSFSDLPDGTRLRRVTVAATLFDEESETPRTITVIYSGSAEGFDDALRHIGVVLLLTGLLCAAASAWVAKWVTAAVVRPLNETADAIGQIDDRNLARRIDAGALPAELRPVADRLNEMLGRLDQGFTLRKQFLADAAHELRTPVAALLTSLEVSLKRPRDLETVRQTMRDCLADVRSLRQLVERLLEHARSDGQSVLEKSEPVDVAQMIDDCARTAATLGAGDNITVNHHSDGRLVANLPPARLRSVLMNLVGNAVEYNRPGGTVEVKSSAIGDTLVLAVRDTGLGIPPEHLPHIFEPFYRGDRARNHEGGHSGLGLFLVRSHIDALNGTCDVQSTAGVGTTFHITIPRVVLPPSDESNASPPFVLKGEFAPTATPR